MLNRMLYVVKALAPTGIITWVTPSGIDGCRSLAGHGRADVFENA